MPYVTTPDYQKYTDFLLANYNARMDRREEYREKNFCSVCGCSDTQIAESGDRLYRYDNGDYVCGDCVGAYDAILKTQHPEWKTGFLMEHLERYLHAVLSELDDPRHRNEQDNFKMQVLHLLRMYDAGKNLFNGENAEQVLLTRDLSGAFQTWCDEECENIREEVK